MKLLLIFAKVLSGILGGALCYLVILFSMMAAAIYFGPLHGLATFVLLISLVISVLIWWSER